MKLRVTDIPDQAVYLVILNASDQIRNATAGTFGAVVDASWADYDHAAAELGTSTGIYVLTWPATLATGSYTAIAYRQLGGAPAVGDLKIGTIAVRDGTTAESGDAVETAVSLVELKRYLRVDGDTEDADVEDALLYAVDTVERETRCATLAGDRVLSLDGFPENEREIRLPFPPLASVESVAYVDAAGDAQSLSLADYVVDTTSKPGRIALKAGESWPSTAGQANAVTITYTAGYASAANVPRAFKQLIKWIAAHAYENREPVVTGSPSADLPYTVKATIESLMFIEAVG